MMVMVVVIMTLTMVMVNDLFVAFWSTEPLSISYLISTTRHFSEENNMVSLTLFCQWGN